MASKLEIFRPKLFFPYWPSHTYVKRLWKSFVCICMQVCIFLLQSSAMKYEHVWTFRVFSDLLAVGYVQTEPPRSKFTVLSPMVMHRKTKGSIFSPTLSSLSFPFTFFFFAKAYAILTNLEWGWFGRRNQPIIPFRRGIGIRDALLIFQKHILRSRDFPKKVSVYY